VADQTSRSRTAVVPLTVLGQDPSVEAPREHPRTAAGPMRVVVPVPIDWVEPGPRSHRFFVVDFDSSTDLLATVDAARLAPAVDRDDVDQWSQRGWLWRDQADLAYDDPRFRAQHVFAVASRTLSLFEAALGRRVPWAFKGSQLFLVPHAFAEANAFYSFEDRAVLFGYLPGDDGEVQTALSFDVVSHEVTHAIVDGLRPNWIEPGPVEQAAFHEGFADVVALLSACSLPAILRDVLAGSGWATRVGTSRLTVDALEKSPLAGIGEQLGARLGGRRAGALRHSTSLLTDRRLVRDPGFWRTEFPEPHRRGEVLVAATLDALFGMWTNRLRPLLESAERDVDLARVIEEGVKAAGHLLTMYIRSLDYCPPVELEFDDFVAAVLVADEELAPDDTYEYRQILEIAFARFDIKAGEKLYGIGASTPLSYRGTNASALRSDRTEISRFIWQNADVLEIDRRWYTEVVDVSPVTRTGPDGLLLNEVVATYVQQLEAPKDWLVSQQLNGASELPDKAVLRMFGGGALVFDQFGRLRLHHTKPLFDLARQAVRLRRLIDDGSADDGDGDHRVGVRDGRTRSSFFQQLHVVDDPYASEIW
jgi:hypothetical protein